MLQLGEAVLAVRNLTVRESPDSFTQLKIAFRLIIPLKSLEDHEDVKYLPCRWNTFHTLRICTEDRYLGT